MDYIFISMGFAASVLAGHYGVGGSRATWCREVISLGLVIIYGFWVGAEMTSAGIRVAAIFGLTALLTAIPHHIQRAMAREGQVSIRYLLRFTAYFALVVWFFTLTDDGIEASACHIALVIGVIAVFYLVRLMQREAPYNSVLGVGLGTVSLMFIFAIVEQSYPSANMNYQEVLKNATLSLGSFHSAGIWVGCLIFTCTTALGPNLVSRRAHLLHQVLPFVSKLGSTLSRDRRDDQWWALDAKTVYLNHGSFGPSPWSVRAEQLRWQQRMNRQPMDFFVRQLEPHWFDARRRLAQFVGCSANDLIFCENATAGMNHLASFFPLSAGDEVLLTDHEYGVVKRIWRARCQEQGAVYREAKLPLPVENKAQIIEAVRQCMTPHTKLLIFSHITSPTAIQLPALDLCRLAKEHGIAVGIDGPHALLQTDVNIGLLDCDFYFASCHKWLCAPFGSGFSFVAPRWQSLAAKPLAVSWGRLSPAELTSWSDHHVWCGTRDYSAYLSVPAAIDFFEQLGIEKVRQRNHELAKYARQQLTMALGTQALTPDHVDWYGSMVAVWLPKGDHVRLQAYLWKEHCLEVPVMEFGGQYLIRVSCHLYNDMRQIEKLVAALRIYFLHIA